MGVHIGGSDFPETIPVWMYGADGSTNKIKNVRPSSYHRNAKKALANSPNQSRNRIGYIMRNVIYGHEMPMTELQYQRIGASLCERGVLKIERYWYNYNVPVEYGLTGFDTECEKSGVYNFQ